MRGGCLCVRHRVYGKHLGRDKNQRKALFRSLIYSLFNYGTIETTETKAKAVKGLVDKIINFGKGETTRHLLQSFVSSKEIMDRIIDISPKYKDRNSGYTSTVRLGTRAGDRAEIVRMSLINNEKLTPVKKAVKKPVSTESKSEKAEVKPGTPAKEKTTQKPAVKKVVKKATKK